MLILPDAPPPRKVAVRVWPRAIPQVGAGAGAAGAAVVGKRWGPVAGKAVAPRQCHPAGRLRNVQAGGAGAAQAAGSTLLCWCASQRLPAATLTTRVAWPPACPLSTSPKLPHTQFNIGHLDRCCATLQRTRTSSPLPCAPPTPQFNIGHLEAVSGAQDAVRASGWDGVLLGGNYVAGERAGMRVQVARVA